MNLKYEQRLQVAAKIILDDDESSGDAAPSEEELGIKATLKPHQVDGISWLIRRYKLGVNVVLGDEMGLGKTLQAISFLSYLKVRQLSHGPFLVICPLSVTDGWVSEIVKYAPKLEVFKYVGDKEYRRSLRRKTHEHVTKQPTHNVMLPFDVLLTSYDIALMDKDFLSQIPWQYAVIDEAQRLKNPSSVLFNVLKDRYIMPRRLLMTGTPIQNNLSELWALMHFCMPSVFGTLDQFLSTFKDISDLTSVNTMKILEVEMKAFLIPQLGGWGRIAMKLEFLTTLRARVIQLRKACSHPYLFPGIEPEPYEEGEHLVQASGKLLILDQLLRKLHHNGHRVLLFAQMTHTLDILQDYLELRKYSYERLDGSIRAEERFAAIRSFSNSSANTGLNFEANQNGAFVFMISTRAGGVGLNLVAADTVIFYEQDWNPQVDRQALQRAHRIGQMNHVLCINLVTEHTVEEVIMRRAERKLQLSLNVTGDNIVEQEDKQLSSVGTGDLKSIIVGLRMFDPNEINDGKDKDMDLTEINAMADKVIAIRDEQIFDKDDRKFEVNPRNFLKGFDVKERGSASFSCDLDLDEASYLAWVKKFEEVSKSSCDSVIDLKSRRNLDEEKSQKLETARKKAEEKKLSKWNAAGYQSLNVEDPISPPDGDTILDAGSVHFVYGDCTAPTNVPSTEPVLIFSCVDTSGRWGHGGMFDALSKLSSSISDAYERAYEHGDLHLGDLHLIRLEDDGNDQNLDGNAPKMVALAVVQSYNPRRKVPRSEISLVHLESCLSKAAFSADQNSASIHMPRIGYQDGSDRSQWYTIERLLRKYASMYNVLLPKITLRIHAVSRHKRDSSDGKKSLKIRFPITLYVHMYVYNIIPDNTSVMFCKSFEVLKHNLHVET
ncbi:chromodomain helicase-DNA-binding-like protein [Medicago truncatula]|uniref:Chromodomain helicase-DNA-binding-like protein n=1 Tax=Medicago truncatula TaxID=3880 RepID=A0A072U902_MEDTR|nr:chromodomain helicase-DNA-binding-like protein [Medicago truncatula]